MNKQAEILPDLIGNLRASGNSNIANILSSCACKESLSSDFSIYGLSLSIGDRFTRSWFDSKVKEVVIMEIESLLQAKGMNCRVEFLIRRNSSIGSKKHRDRPGNERTSLAQRLGIDFWVSPELNLDNYIVGEANKFAHEVSLNMVSSANPAVSPVTFYGASGVGKSHLLNTLSLRLQDQGCWQNVLYCDITSFLAGFRKSLASKRERAFMDSCKEADFLLLDDLHFLQDGSGEESQQAIVFDLLNNFLRRTKPTVITSEGYPDTYRSIKPRIKTRLKSGLIIEIKPPEFNLRYIILDRNARARGLTLTQEALEFLASSIKKCPRDLVGAAKKLAAQANLIQLKQPAGLDFVKSVLADQLHYSQKPIDIGEIMQVVAEYFRLRVADLRSSNKTRLVTTPRYIAMYLAREHTDMSFPDIAKEFNKHHTTVIHGCELIAQQQKEDRKLKTNLNFLNGILNE